MREIFFKIERIGLARCGLTFLSPTRLGLQCATPLRGGAPGHEFYSFLQKVINAVLWGLLHYRCAIPTLRQFPVLCWIPHRNNFQSFVEFHIVTICSISLNVFPKLFQDVHVVRCVYRCSDEQRHNHNLPHKFLLPYFYGGVFPPTFYVFVQGL